jgi:hypothetical protein
MMMKNRMMIARYTAAFSAVFFFVSTFANSLHTHRHVEFTSTNSSCTIEKQAAEINVASEGHNDFDGDCAACSYLLSAQGVYFDNIRLPGKQACVRYSVSEKIFFHNNLLIEYLPRAPPYFTV